MKFKIGDRVKVTTITDAAMIYFKYIGKAGVVVNIDPPSGNQTEIYVVQIDGEQHEYCGSLNGEDCFGLALWPEELELDKTK